MSVVPSPDLNRFGEDAAEISKKLRLDIEDIVIGAYKQSLENYANYSKEATIAAVEHEISEMFKALDPVLEHTLKNTISESAATRAFAKVVLRLADKCPHFFLSEDGIKFLKSFSSCISDLTDDPKKRANEIGWKTLTENVRNGTLHELLYQETTFMHILNAAARAQLHAVNQAAFFSYTLIRDDYVSAIEGSENSAVIYECCGGYYFANAPFLPSETLISDLKTVATYGVLRSQPFEPINLSEIDDFEVPETLKGSKLVVIPVTHGDIFLGALVNVGPATAEFPFSPEVRKNLLLCADACSKALAHLVRIKKLSGDF